MSSTSVTFTAVKTAMLPPVVGKRSACATNTASARLCLCEQAPFHSVSMPSKHITSWRELVTESCQQMGKLRLEVPEVELKTQLVCFTSLRNSPIKSILIHSLMRVGQRV